MEKMDEEEFELRNETAYWAGMLIGYDRQWEVAKEIVETIKHAHSLVKKSNNIQPVIVRVCKHYVSGTDTAMNCINCGNPRWTHDF